jgi:hypothetical protein
VIPNVFSRLFNSIASAFGMPSAEQRRFERFEQKFRGLPPNDPEHRSIAAAFRHVDPERWEAELLERVRELTPEEPLAGARIGGKELAARLIAAMSVNEEAHVPSLMCAAGALAGYSCQAAVRAINRICGLDERANMQIVQTADGECFYFGDLLNKYLAEGEICVWSLVAGGAQSCGCTDYPDLESIFRHVASTVGTESFGMPRICKIHRAEELPRAYLERIWPQLSPMVSRFCTNPAHWPMMHGLAIQDLFVQTQHLLEPRVSLQIIMEAAIPMSKVDMSKAFS